MLNFQFSEKQFIRMTKYTSNNKNQTYKLCIGILFTRLVTTILYNQSTEGENAVDNTSNRLLEYLFTLTNIDMQLQGQVY